MPRPGPDLHDPLARPDGGGLDDALEDRAVDQVVLRERPARREAVARR